ncbi:HSP20 family molecular chaperone IbpA [Kushneria sinocarnis]|uniref:HSP20 family molecular chaperone IbpA n=1 Tax=Kushneria sinocarnis TaxID=595502 RepID=A0A420WWK3_9GAMM|nr:Hsp20 family protein [Kushneria sinocarnis]RKR03491.1 HSP20 family molecular chaperone IbpA [Kushneria sinocarnis]
MASLAFTPSLSENGTATPLPDPIAAARRGEAPGPLPCDIEQDSDNDYRLTVPATGLSGRDLSIRVEEHVLTISSRPEDDRRDRSAIRLYRGIERQPFELAFRLDDHISVRRARLANGLLSLELHRGATEAPREQRVVVNSGADTTVRQRLSRIRPLRGTRRSRLAHLGATDE